MRRVGEMKVVMVKEGGNCWFCISVVIKITNH